MKMIKLIPFLLIVLLIPTSTSGYYEESFSYYTDEGTEYYYSLYSDYSTWYIGEIMYLDIEFVVDYFGYDSDEIYDVEMWVAGEDFAGNTIFELSHLSYSYIDFDGDGILFEFDIEITVDFPEDLYLFISGNFYEDSYYYYGEYYEDEWIEMATFYIGDDVRPVNNPPANTDPVYNDPPADRSRTDFPMISLIGAIVIIIPLRKLKVKNN